MSREDCSLLDDDVSIYFSSHAYPIELDTDQLYNRSPDAKPNDTFWISYCLKNSHIIFDFQGAQACPTKIHLSFPVFDEIAHGDFLVPTTLEFQYSDDYLVWRTIDTIEKNQIRIGSSSAEYECDREYNGIGYHQFFKLVMIGTNRGGTYSFALSHIDLNGHKR